MVEENTVSEDVVQESGPAEIPIVKAPPIESRFLFVDVAALRAKQLRRGARSRLAGPVEGQAETVEVPRKAERVAMEEVRQCLVQWDLPDSKHPVEGEQR